MVAPSFASTLETRRNTKGKKKKNRKAQTIERAITSNKKRSNKEDMDTLVHIGQHRKTFPLSCTQIWWVESAQCLQWNKSKCRCHNCTSYILATVFMTWDKILLPSSFLITNLNWFHHGTIYAGLVTSGYQVSSNGVWARSACNFCSCAWSHRTLHFIDWTSNWWDLIRREPHWSCSKKGMFEGNLR